MCFHDGAVSDSWLVENATRNLFVAFDGTKLSKETYEDRVGS
jgi:hypothetical protein